MDSQSEPRKPAYQLTPEQLAQAERDERELKSIFDQMDSAPPDPMLEAERRRMQVVCAIGGMVGFVVLWVLAARSASPWSVWGGGAALVAGAFLWGTCDRQNPLVFGPAGLLCSTGTLSLMWGIMVTSGDGGDSEFRRHNALQMSTQQEATEMLSETFEHAARAAIMDAVEQSQSAPTPRPKSLP